VGLALTTMSGAFSPISAQSRAGDITRVDAVEQRALLGDLRCSPMQVAVGRNASSRDKRRLVGVERLGEAEGLALAAGLHECAIQPQLLCRIRLAEERRCFARERHIVPANDLTVELCAFRSLRRRC
jgi:hypothetical protein